MSYDHPKLRTGCNSERSEAIRFGARPQFVAHVISVIRANRKWGRPEDEIPGIVARFRKNVPEWFR